MYIIQISDSKVIDILNARNDVTSETIKVVSEIPVFEPREGYNGVLMFDEESGLYWDYVEVPANTEPTIEEKAAAYDVLMGVSV